jgi:antitoxin component YwqK of YwqJK toxin-antitoxin module
MKNYCSFLFYYFQLLLLAKKYYTKTLKNYLPLKAAYYSTYENDKALLEALILLMEQNALRSIFKFQKRILNGKSESWYKMEIKKRIVLHKGKMNGISTLYYENSQIKRIENYKMMNLLTENVLMKTELKLLFFLLYKT